MSDNNDTRTPAELQEWLAQVERNYRWDETSGRLEHNHYGGEYMPHSARSIPRLCQELRRAWSVIDMAQQMVSNGNFLHANQHDYDAYVGLYDALEKNGFDPKKYRTQEQAE